MRWSNYSCNASPNVTIEMYCYTLGLRPTTILDSDSDGINFSVYSFGSPVIYIDTNDSQTDLYFWLSDFSDIRPGTISDMYVYLPQGPSYNFTINNLGANRSENKVSNNYSGGNLTLWVNDPQHEPAPRYYPVTLTPL